VGCIYALDVTKGRSAEVYAPDDQVTRAEMAAFLERLYEALTS
jgi:hypothetical protein